MITPSHTALDVSLEQWLQEELGLSSGFVASLFHERRVRCGGREARPNSPIRAGIKIWLHGTSPREGQVPPSPPSLQSSSGGGQALVSSTEPLSPAVLYEDEHILIVDKPAGLLVHSDGTGVSDTLMTRVEEYFRACGEDVHPFHVHRLDKGTTGCLLFAKHEFAARTLDSMMVHRQIHRTYVAVVSGRLPLAAGRFEAPIGRDRHRAGAYRVSVTGKAAITNYRQLRSRANETRQGPKARQAYRARQGSGADEEVISLVTCSLETGRTHQIRVHLSAAGCPIVGDELYGGRPNGDGWEWTGNGLALHAIHLSLVHPYSKERLNIEAPLPEPLKRLMEEFGWQDAVL
jgi:23S rRNA pseudouridine1911/1915/1917 synthase